MAASQELLEILGRISGLQSESRNSSLTECVECKRVYQSATNIVMLIDEATMKSKAMKSLRHCWLSPQLRVIETQAMYGLQGQDTAHHLTEPRWNWSDVRKVLVACVFSVRLATPFWPLLRSSR